MCHFEYTNFVQSAVQGLGPGMVGLHLRGKTAQAQRQPMLRVEVAVQWFVVCSFCLTTKVSGAGAPQVRRVPTQAMKMAKPWPVLASA